MKEQHENAYRALLRQARKRLDSDESRYGRIIDYLKFRMQGRARIDAHTVTTYFRENAGVANVKQWRESIPCDFGQYRAAPVKNIETEHVIFNR